MMRTPTLAVSTGALALLAGLSACGTDAQNFGVNSVNQPVVTGDRAYVPNCPNWSSAGRDSAALTDSNYGCATNSDLAAMVANPADLLHGRADTGTDAATAVKAVKAWHDAPATATQWQATVKESATQSAGGGGSQ